MNYMVAYLSDEYLREIAGYYALPPAYAFPQEKSSSELLARGEALMLRGDPARKIPPCAACHPTAISRRALDVTNV